MPFTSHTQNAMRLAARRLPVLDFLAPSLAQNIRQPQYMPALRRASSAVATSKRDSDTGVATEGSRTPRAGSEGTAKSAPLRKPLTKAQRDFLTSAVSIINVIKYRLKAITDNYLIPVTSESSRRVSRNANLHRTNTTRSSLTSASTTPNEAHARPRSWTLQDLQ